MRVIDNKYRISYILKFFFLLLIIISALTLFLEYFLNLEKDFFYLLFFSIIISIWIISFIFLFIINIIEWIHFKKDKKNINAFNNLLTFCIYFLVIITVSLMILFLSKNLSFFNEKLIYIFIGNTTLFVFVSFFFTIYNYKKNIKIELKKWN